MGRFSCQTNPSARYKRVGSQTRRQRFTGRCLLWGQEKSWALQIYRLTTPAPPPPFLSFLFDCAPPIRLFIPTCSRLLVFFSPEAPGCLLDGDLKVVEKILYRFRSFFCFVLFCFVGILFAKCFQCLDKKEKFNSKTRATLCNAGTVGVNSCDLVVITCLRL